MGERLKSQSLAETYASLMMTGNPLYTYGHEHGNSDPGTRHLVSASARSVVERRHIQETVLIEADCTWPGIAVENEEEL